MDYSYATATFPLEVCLPSWEAQQKVAVMSFGVSLLQEDVMEHDQCVHIAALAGKTEVNGAGCCG